MTKHPHHSRYRRLAIGLALYLSAVAIGLGSAWWVLRKVTWSGTVVQVGAWTGSTLTGSPDADMYTRAKVALEGLLALGRNETALKDHHPVRAGGASPPMRTTSFCLMHPTSITA
jgi:hypothetical protein